MTAGVSEKQAEMLRYAVKVTQAPATVSVEDIHRLRQNGFSDRGVLEINLAAAYMNFVNRVVLGLGVELEESREGFTR
jgi:alkylhydroperoxidase family enzyme